ncbi:MAG: hypothetical protein E7426_04960 [Ruminococcaceae bacterium]|jgi:hypothetical protein|nr:hypothetical protein [Oscillospiraceae bacterium]
MKRVLPITDPVRHAAALTGRSCRLLSDDCPWREDMAFHTVNEFGGLGRGFHQHCGPTAVTNLVCAAVRRRDPAHAEDVDPARIFSRAADIGRRRLTYWNIHERFHVGGTSYLLLRAYVAACLRQFGMSGARVTARLKASPEKMAEEIRRGRLLCLAMYRHRCYGSHLVVAYGAVQVAVEGEAVPRLYFRVADGWSTTPRYILADSLRLCSCISVELQQL